jgi:7-cyano-7-deazaguanine synthase
MKKCVIIFSGGLDSTTIVALAKSQNYDVHALTFDYGQRHRIEIQNAKKIAQLYDIPHKIFNIDLASLGGSALTDAKIDVPKYNNIKEIPDVITSTYVPARNIIFLSIALSYAETTRASAIFYGANKHDVHNYPDCTKEFFDSFVKMAKLGTKAGVEGSGIEILAPLIDMYKHEIIKLGMSLGVDYANTISCYDPSPDGHACGKCLSCQVRQENFRKLGIKDPAIYTKHI